MANLTISVAGDILKRARMRALQEDTSVNAVLAGYLLDYARADDVRRDRLEALERIIALADQANTGSGGRSWTRDGLVVETALAEGARRLVSEDLHDGWQVEGMRVCNPLR